MIEYVIKERLEHVINTVRVPEGNTPRIPEKQDKLPG